MNLLNLERVSKSYGVRPLLSEVSLGIGAGDRIGIVGRNGDGKTTLLEVMTGIEEPDAGRVGTHLLERLRCRVEVELRDEAKPTDEPERVLRKARRRHGGL